MKKFIIAVLSAAAALSAVSCGEKPVIENPAIPDKVEIRTEDIALLLSELPIGSEQLEEVHDAVCASAGNGYDEEYTMSDLFRSPGAGVGDAVLETRGIPVTRAYSEPIRDMITEYLSSAATRSDSGFNGLGESITPEEYLEALRSSGLQIYWPYSEKWDGETMPVLTFDPRSSSDVNVGYLPYVAEDGSRRIREVTVDEEYASEHPVWVVNTNDDSSVTSLEMLRKMDPEWGTSGGDVIVGVQSPAGASAPGMTANGAEVGPMTKGKDFRTLVIKNFTAKRNYDPWFAGASEFFVRCGSIESFRAKDESELSLYKPAITDFMVVVRRGQVNCPVNFNAVLVSDWTEQFDECAFMITEEDGGTRDEWKCSATVKIASKSYGFEIVLPFYTRDDIVWRGKLAGQYIEKYNKTKSRLGDVEIEFEILEK